MTKTFIAIACVLGSAACGASDGGVSTSTEQTVTSCGAADVGAAARAPEPMARQVAFSTEVLPIFVSSCGFGECHGSTQGHNSGVFLGAQDGKSDPKAIRTSLVGKPSRESPSTPYVTPSDPSRSFLFRKLEGDMCGLSECGGSGTADACGKAMPRGGEKLDAASLELVRSWIAQGATDS